MNSDFRKLVLNVFDTRDAENFLQFSVGERKMGRGERRARNNLNPEGRAERGNKVTHGDT